MFMTSLRRRMSYKHIHLLCGSIITIGVILICIKSIKMNVSTAKNELPVRHTGSIIRNKQDQQKKYMYAHALQIYQQPQSASKLLKLKTKALEKHNNLIDKRIKLLKSLSTHGKRITSILSRKMKKRMRRQWGPYRKVRIRIRRTRNRLLGPLSI